MAIKLISTKDAATNNGVKMLVYGRAGVGKTTLCAAAPNPIILSAESGLLSLRGYDIPVIEIKTMQDLWDSYSYLTGSDGSKYETICLDSISEIAEVVLADNKKATKDPRQAYGEMATQMQEIVRAFRDLPRFNVYFSAKEEYIKDEFGVSRFGPSMPGRQVGPAMPYFFDEVFRLDVGKDKEGKPFRYLATQADIQYEAKDRSGCLDRFEAPSLAHIINKIKNSNPTTEASNG